MISPNLIERVLDRFVNGNLSRREAVAALFALASPAAAAAPLTPRSINHVTLRVSDLVKSQAFYQKVLNAPVIGQSDFECDLGLGSGFVALMTSKNQPTIDHFCVGVEGYDASRVADELARQGLQPKKIDSFQGVRFKEAQVYVRDPDGINVQFSRPDYAGEMKK
jgi:glyoxylase I family protein